MGRFKFIITEEEKNEILSLHNLRNHKSNLIKEVNGLERTDFPKCVQDMGPNGKSTDGTYGYIDGTKKYYDWTGYLFYANNRVKKPDGTMDSYFCKGNEPVLGVKMAATKGRKTTTADLGGTIIKLGSSGDSVKKIQNALAASGDLGDGKTIGGNENCGKDVNSCDGKFGQGTKNAVKAFQVKMNIEDDGIVGDETWQQLFGGGAPVQSTQKQSEPEQSESEQNERQKNINTNYCSVTGDDLIIRAPGAWGGKNLTINDFNSAYNITSSESLMAIDSCPDSYFYKNRDLYRKLFGG